MRTMIVEGDRLTALSLETFVRFCGHDVAGRCSSATDVLQRVQSTPRPDLVLMSVDPQNRLSALDCARTLFKRYSIPVVFVAAAPSATGPGRDAAVVSMLTPATESAALAGPRTAEATAVH